MFANQLNVRRSLATLLLVVLSFTSIGSTFAQSFPDVIPLPDGFQPEGIATGTGTTFYVGSIPTGAVYRGDLRTGEGEVLVQPQTGRAAIGLKYDDRSGLLFVAGGPTGFAYVYDGETGANVAAALEVASRPEFKGKRIVTVACSFAERYISSALFEGL